MGARYYRALHRRVWGLDPLPSRLDCAYSASIPHVCTPSTIVMCGFHGWRRYRPVPIYCVCTLHSPMPIRLCARHAGMAMRLWSMA